MLRQFVFLLLVYSGHIMGKELELNKDLTINITQVPISTLRAIQTKHGQLNDNRTLNQNNNRGFTILYRNKKTNKYRCEVFVLDKNDKETIKHELQHCAGQNHNIFFK